MDLSLNVLAFVALSGVIHAKRSRIRTSIRDSCSAQVSIRGSGCGLDPTAAHFGIFGDIALLKMFNLQIRTNPFFNSHALTRTKIAFPAL